MSGPSEPELTGLFPAALVRARTIQRPAPEIVAGFLELPDLSGTVSDACDALGIPAGVPGSVLRAMTPGARLVGPLLTVRSELRGAVEIPGGRMGDIEVHNLAAPGDVLVVQGVDRVSSLGGISARLGRRQREAGAIVDGAVRDVASLRGLGYPVWARGTSPLTGKHRLRTVEINGVVTIGGRSVAPGDLAVADDTGVCFVPRERAAEVLARAREIVAKEAERVARIDAGVSVRDLARG
jgi:regulator of RNase E activity RraA